MKALAFRVVVIAAMVGVGSCDSSDPPSVERAAMAVSGGDETVVDQAPGFSCVEEDSPTQIALSLRGAGFHHMIAAGDDLLVPLAVENARALPGELVLSIRLVANGLDLTVEQSERLAADTSAVDVRFPRSLAPTALFKTSGELQIRGHAKFVDGSEVVSNAVYAYFHRVSGRGFALYSSATRDAVYNGGVFDAEEQVARAAAAAAAADLVKADYSLNIVVTKISESAEFIPSNFDGE